MKIHFFQQQINSLKFNNLKIKAGVIKKKKEIKSINLTINNSKAKIKELTTRIKQTNESFKWLASNGKIYHENFIIVLIKNFNLFKQNITSQTSSF